MSYFLKNKKIIIAPLNWGLGHATRCVPIINYLMTNEAEVTIASDGNALEFLKKCFPTLPFLELPSYNVKYGKLNFSIQTAINFPSYLKAVYEENSLLKKYLKTHKIDIIISDNRYGFYHNDVASVIICHQICMLTPSGASALRPYLYRLHKSFLKPFDKIWIPDFESDDYNLSGAMSHEVVLPKNARFIGPLTRAERNRDDDKSFEAYILVMLSGVEPQRTYLEEKLISQASKIKSEKFIFLKGIVDDKSEVLESNITILPYASGDKLNELLLDAKVVVCRSGYSSVMDLYYLGKKVIFIPSKGQTEQEYLSNIAAKKGWAIEMKEDNLILAEAIQHVEKTKGLPTYNKDISLIEAAFKGLVS